MKQTEAFVCSTSVRLTGLMQDKPFQVLALHMFSYRRVVVRTWPNYKYVQH